MCRFFLYFCILVFLLPDTLQAKQALQVFVSIPPQQYLVERIGGPFVDVDVMLQPGDSPETFDPKPRHISALNSAQLYFRIGLAFEKKWLKSIDPDKSEMKIVDCCDDIIQRQSNFLDNHVWTSSRNIQVLAGVIKKELTAIDSDHSQEFEQNYRELIIELEQLDKEIHTLLSQRRTDYFIISHAALGHFAEDYGLIQVSLESDGKELGARGLVNTIKQAKREQIHTLFVQKQHLSGAATIFANEIGAEVVVVDPLDGDYIANLRSITKLIARATQ